MENHFAQIAAVPEGSIEGEDAPAGPMITAAHDESYGPRSSNGIEDISVDSPIQLTHTSIFAGTGYVHKIFDRRYDAGFASALESFGRRGLS